MTGWEDRLRGPTAAAVAPPRAGPQHMHPAERDHDGRRVETHGGGVTGAQVRHRAGEQRDVRGQGDGREERETQRGADDEHHAVRAPTIRGRGVRGWVRGGGVRRSARRAAYFVYATPSPYRSRQRVTSWSTKYRSVRMKTMSWKGRGEQGEQGDGGQDPAGGAVRGARGEGGQGGDGEVGRDPAR